MITTSFDQTNSRAWLKTPFNSLLILPFIPSQRPPDLSGRVFMDCIILATFQTTNLLSHGTIQKFVNRRVSDGELYLIVTNAALTSPVSRQWKVYWQREAV